MTFHRVSVIAITLVLGLSGAQAWEIGDKSCTAESDARALDVLREKVRAERLYTSWAKEQCLSFYPERCDGTVVDVAIRELHSEHCGGDPDTGPVVDRFRVFKKPSKIEWFDHIEGEYVEFDKIHSKKRR